MREGRPGPVWLDVPLDVQAAPIDPEKLIGFQPPLARIKTELESAFIEIDKLLANAKRPLILAGHGVRISGAAEDFKKLVNKYNGKLDMNILLEYDELNNRLIEDIKITLTTDREDVERSLRYYIKDHKVIRFNHVGFKTKFFNKGGHGLLEERINTIYKDVKNLDENFVGYGKIKQKKKCPDFVLNYRHKWD
jgi:hypothetical protein